MKIYVASSWRNDIQPLVVETLRAEGHEVYDFKNPPSGTGFSWAQVDPNWENWTNEEYLQALEHPIAKAGYQSDFDAMCWADACVLVLPCGRSAHTEAGWMQGKGKPTIVFLAPDEPELMYKIYEGCYTNITDVLEHLKRLDKAAKDSLAPVSACL